MMVAHTITQVAGSATACVMELDPERGVLTAANLVRAMALLRQTEGKLATCPACILHKRGIRHVTQRMEAQLRMHCCELVKLSLRCTMRAERAGMLATPLITAFPPSPMEHPECVET
jgi:hypothetical protein